MKSQPKKRAVFACFQASNDFHFSFRKAPVPRVPGIARSSRSLLRGKRRPPHAFVRRSCLFCFILPLISGGRCCVRSETRSIEVVTFRNAFCNYIGFFEIDDLDLALFIFHSFLHFSFSSLTLRACTSERNCNTLPPD